MPCRAASGAEDTQHRPKDPTEGADMATRLGVRAAGRLQQSVQLVWDVHKVSLRVSVNGF